MPVVNGGSPDTFVINDLALKIPPSNIQFRQEDLTYQWKTLRSNGSTKIPSGHGQMNVSVSIPFTEDQLLTLHRLIVQFRQSPFCQIDNRYLRESLVPDWPFHQMMAFTMLGMKVYAVPGKTDLWNCELDMTWFNYFPYLHNFLYREDWETEWLRIGDGFARYTIGWDTEGSQRLPRWVSTNHKSLLDPMTKSFDQWDAVTQDLRQKEFRTVDEMEVLHEGQVFDMLPMPGRMSPSRFVWYARDSRIYKRYCNYLQRDALMRNFGIEVEADLLSLADQQHPGDWWKWLYMGISADDNGFPMTGSLNEVPASLQRKWIGQMLKWNGGVVFGFDTYKSIRLPPEMTAKQQQQQKSILEEILAQGRTGLVGDTAKDTEQGKFSYRNGYTHADQKRIPLRASISDLNTKYMSKVGDERSAATNATIYQGARAVATTHKGTDISLRTDGKEYAWPVYAVEDGIVSQLNGGARLASNWRSIDLGSGAFSHTYQSKDVPKNGAEYLELLDSLEANSIIDSQVNVHLDQLTRAGMIVRSVHNPNIIYYADHSTAGQGVEIRHLEFGGLPASYSCYYHLSQVLVQKGQKVSKNGGPIGYAGNTSVLDPTFLVWFWNTQGQHDVESRLTNQGVWSQYSSTPGLVLETTGYRSAQFAKRDKPAVTPFTVIPHLHFEYWEPREARQNSPLASSTDTAQSGRFNLTTHIPVDPRPSYQGSEDQQSCFIRKTLTDQLMDAAEAVEQGAKQLAEAGKLQDYQASELISLFAALKVDGWVYYEDNRNVQNVWRKPLLLGVAPSKFDGSAVMQNMLQGLHEGNYNKSIFASDDAVFTGVAGQLKHVVVHLPILSQEYPTQQHLGSIEPSYTFEFQLLDDHADLEGVGPTGQLLQGMRSRLQLNAREFRPILDGWTCMADTFITRLFGTVQVQDIKGGVESGDMTFRKRVMFARTAGGTVPGNPGLSTLTVELEETNPYEVQKVVAEAPKLPEIEAARAKVLNTLYSWNEKVQLERREYSAQDRLLLDMLQDGRLQPLTFGVPTDYYFQGAISDADHDLILSIPGAHQAEPVQEQEGGRLIVPGQAVNDLQDGRASFKRCESFQEYLWGIITTADLILAEESLNGLYEAAVQKQMYDLPIHPNMWQGFQAYFDYYISKIADQELQHVLSRNQNYLEMGDELTHPLSGAEFGVTRSAAWAFLGTSNMWRDGVVTGSAFNNPFPQLQDPNLAWYWKLAGLGAHVAGAPLQGIRAVELAFIQPVGRGMSRLIGWGDGIGGDERDDLANFRRGFCRNYLAWLPLTVGGLVSSTAINSYVEEQVKWAGAQILPELFGNSTQNPAFQGIVDSFYSYMASTNLLFYQVGRFTGIIQPPGEGLVKDAAGNWGYGLNYDDSTSIQELYAGPRALQLNPSTQFENIPIGSPAYYRVVESEEQAKVTFLKDLLARLADEIRSDVEVLRELGLEQIALLDLSNQYKGRECYPDLMLPFHPYYQDSYSVGPDFFMWNMYEDAGAFNKDMQEEIFRSTYVVLKNAHDSMSLLQRGSKFDASQSLVQDPNADPTYLRFAAEGSDAVLTKTEENDLNGVFVSHGATGYPTAQTRESMEDENAFYQKLQTGQPAGYELLPQSKTDGLQVSSQKPPLITSSLGSLGASVEDGYDIRLSHTDGSPQYPMRADHNTYKDLMRKVNATEQMFGSGAGYTGTFLTPENIKSKRTTQIDTALASHSEYVHGFSLDFLAQLAKDSSKDMIGQKMTLRRAFPTFKLYFVEEDEFETRYINFDDFYSYNQVKDMTVVLSRTMSADTAVIRLQNIAGTLDGSMRDTVTDLDYFDPSKDKQTKALEPGSSLLQDSPVQAGSSADQPFGQLTLRPGLNVQLRVGYSNDPNCLEVLISGRVVDVIWNQQGDMAEITVQGFGAELEQHLKGSTSYQGKSDYRTFQTTHQLLCTLMLEPELAHFGRWEFGQFYQPGESQDASLDFVDYARESTLSKFSWTRSIGNWMTNHPLIAGAAVLGFYALQFVPVGKAAGKVPKLLQNVFGVGLKGATPVSLKAGSGLAVEVSEVLTRQGVGGLTDDAAKLAFRAELKQPIYKAIRDSFGIGTQLIDDEVKVASGSFGFHGERFLRGNAILEGIIDSGLTDDAISKLATGNTTVAQFLEASVKPVIAKAQFRHGINQALNYPVWAPVNMQSIGSGILHGAGALMDPRPHLYFGAIISSLAVGTGLSLDAFSYTYGNILRRIYERTVGNMQKSFTKTQVKLHLTPQDDNIFAPSPKDYMTVEASGWWDTAKDFAAYGVGGILLGKDERYQAVRGYLFPNMVIERRVDPLQCQYSLISSTIWDVFYEMTLRHPGWIFGCRPYGREFRYTMFFGVPSQRYWSKGANNRFLLRMNDLRDALTDVTVTEAEYIKLYGPETESGETLQHMKDRVYDSVAGVQNPEELIDGRFDDSEDVGVSPQARGNSVVAGNQSIYYTSRVMQEYLKGLELRFVPFRRYHMLQSHRDIIWNGIQGSESNVINGIDTIYYNVDAELSDGTPYGSELIKASSTMSESMMHISPINYPNCRGYTMALRYGMGELIYQMKNMYRGELVVIGNARIRPWDICILQDTYNDMIGPIEVEQVVHNFSHETGFITEIKPNAVVVANEISSWPMIEAMKMMSLAVADAERSYGQKDSMLTTTADLVFGNWGAGRVETLIQKKYRSAAFFGPSGAGLVKDVLGEGQPLAQSLRPDTDQDPSLGSLTGYLERPGILSAISLEADIGEAYATKFNQAITPYAAKGNVAETIQFRSGTAARAFDTMDQPPGLVWLIAAPILLAKCLREDAIMIVPLVKNGNPIVAGLNYNDPSTVWRTFVGNLRNYVQDGLLGMQHASALYSQYGSSTWRQLGDPTVTDIVEAGLSGRSLQDVTNDR